MKKIITHKAHPWHGIKQGADFPEVVRAFIDLMHDFHCKKADDMKNKLLAERTRYLKENEKGVKHMCRIMEEMAKEERDERTIEMAAKILERT